MPKEILISPLTGTLMIRCFNNGDDVEAGKEVMFLESMKMSFPIVAGSSGKISYNYNEGELIYSDDIVAEIEF